MRSGLRSALQLTMLRLKHIQMQLRVIKRRKMSGLQRTRSWVKI